MDNECEIKFNHMNTKYYIKGEFKNYTQKFKGFNNDGLPIYELNLKMMFLGDKKTIKVDEK